MTVFELNCRWTPKFHCSEYGSLAFGSRYHSTCPNGVGAGKPAEPRPASGSCQFAVATCLDVFNAGVSICATDGQSTPMPCTVCMTPAQRSLNMPNEARTTVLSLRL